MDRNSFAFGRFGVVIGLLLVLAACGQRIGSAPVINGATGERLGDTSVQADLPTAVTVQRGDSLYKISRRYNVRLRAIIDANNLKPPYTIFPGQKLRMPVTGVHVVARGETVYQIARRYGAEPGALVRLNRIAPPYRLYAGQRLVLPGASAEAPAVQTTAQSAAQPAASPLIGRLRQQPEITTDIYQAFNPLEADNIAGPAQGTAFQTGRGEACTVDFRVSETTAQSRRISVAAERGTRLVAIRHAGQRPSE